MPVSLISPTPELHESWLDARREWGGAAVPQPGSGNWLAIDQGLDLDRPGEFARWVEILNNMPRRPFADDEVPATNWWIVRENTYLGAIQLRHVLNKNLAELGGHIGYGIRPSARRQGVVTTALRAVLDHAAALGLPEVLITCDASNMASQRTAEAAGGTLRRVREVDDYARAHGRTEPILHYWVGTAAHDRF